MTGLILEFADDVTEEEETNLIDDPKVHQGRLRMPRTSYLSLVESARKARGEWVLRDGAEFICDTCKSFIVPAKAVYMAIIKTSGWNGDTDNEHGEFWHYGVIRCLTKPYPMTDADWQAYDEGKLKHIPFIYDKDGLVFEFEEGPQVFAYDEVVFKFRRKCVCDGVYKRMYDNVR